MFENLIIVLVILAIIALVPSIVLGGMSTVDVAHVISASGLKGNAIALDGTTIPQYLSVTVPLNVLDYVAFHGYGALIEHRDYRTILKMMVDVAASDGYGLGLCVFKEDDGLMYLGLDAQHGFNFNLVRHYITSGAGAATFDTSGIAIVDNALVKLEMSSKFFRNDDGDLLVTLRHWIDDVDAGWNYTYNLGAISGYVVCPAVFVDTGSGVQRVFKLYDISRRVL